MYVSLDKGNEEDAVVLAKMGDWGANLIYRNQRKKSNPCEVCLTETETLNLCRRAIKKGMFKKSDL